MKLTIGENIRRFRKKHDLTQEAFAERLGLLINRSAVGRTARPIPIWSSFPLFPKRSR